ncbi:M28 family peptidase [Halobium salinum]|uniref:Carboxypeptidase Q n=1 Tax=Halobium salinum TaxID=1364940 RepID=A0ABD5PFA8_9EURY|nr:M28 family metallopeptidase [Halobium salinum]
MSSGCNSESVNYETFGRAWTDDRPWKLLTGLTALEHRMAGSEGEAAAADLVADALRGAGVDDVEQAPFEMNRWRREETEFAVVEPDERPFDAIALPYSPAGAVEAPLVDVGHGTPAEVDEVDVAGRIAVASTTTPEGGRFVHRMEKFGHAVDAGAVGFVFANHVAGQLPPTGSLRFNEEAAAVAVGVSEETGEWLREYADRGGAARIDVDADTRPGESQNVYGRVGPDTDEEVLLLAHYDAHDIAEGALDNGCGVAVVVAAARILADCDLPLGVRIGLVGCEEVGLLGSEQMADSTDLDSVRAVVNVDGAGRFRNLVAMTHASEATADTAESVSAATGHPIEVQENPHPFSDQWPFVKRGVPALQLHSDSGERGRGWGHTEADTRDKVDVRNVREHAMLTALLVAELAGGEAPPRLDGEALAERFRDLDFERGMRAADLWPEAWV